MSTETETTTVEIVSNEEGVKITEYNATQAALAKLEEQYKGIVFEIKTTKGMTEAKDARKQLRDLRTGLEAKRRKLKAPILKYSKALDGQAKEITARIEALEDPVDQQIKAEEARKALAKAAEHKRIDAHREVIEGIRNRPLALIGAKPDEIEKAFNEVQGVDVSGLEEFQSEACLVRDEAAGKLHDLLTHARAADEAEAARIERAKEEAEAARQRAEEAEKAKAEAEKVRQAELAELEELRRFKEEQEAVAKLREEKEARQAELAKMKSETANRILATTGRLPTGRLNEDGWYEDAPDFKAREAAEAETEMLANPTTEELQATFSETVRRAQEEAGKLTDVHPIPLGTPATWSGFDPALKDAETTGRGIAYVSEEGVKHIPIADTLPEEKDYEVRVNSSGFMIETTTYKVRATSAEDAMARWHDGEMLESETVVDNRAHKAESAEVIES